MNPAAGTVWSTATGVTQRSPTRCSASSISVRYFTTGTSGWGILLKSGQSDVVEDAGAERGDDRIDAGDRDRRPDLAEGERLGEVHEAGDVVQMGVRDDRVLDGKLVGNGERAAHAAGVDEHLVVDEKGRRAMPETFAAEGAEHANLHAVAILAHAVVR